MLLNGSCDVKRQVLPVKLELDFCFLPFSEDELGWRSHAMAGVFNGTTLAGRDGVLLNHFSASAFVANPL